MTAEEILNQGQDKIKELTAGVDMMKFTLAIEEELHSLPFPEVSIYINGNKVSGEPGLCIDQLWHGCERELEELVEKKIEERKKAAKLILMKAGVGIAADEKEVPEDQPIDITEAEPEEVAPVQQPQAPEDHGEKNTLSDEELRNMYFKQGMAVKAISEKTGLGPSGLYKRLEKMKKSIENNAKEYARQIR